jgi:hypothetical protein
VTIFFNVSIILLYYFVILFIFRIFLEDKRKEEKIYLQFVLEGFERREKEGFFGLRDHGLGNVCL